MFDLEAEIAKWRVGLEAAGIAPTTAQELESHLRDEIDRSRADGVAAQAAFELAKWRLGRPDDLRREFRRAKPALAFLNHGWMRQAGRLALGGCVGASVGLALYFLVPVPFRSQAKVLVKYVVADSPPVQRAGPSPDPRSDRIMETQMQVLTSVDVAREAASAVGPEKILAKFGGGQSLPKATAQVSQGLSVQMAAGGSVITATFHHADPALVRPILGEVIHHYLRLGGVVNGTTQWLQIIESPTEAFQDMSKSRERVAWLLGAGLLAGAFWAAYDQRRNGPSKPPPGAAPNLGDRAAI